LNQIGLRGKFRLLKQRKSITRNKPHKILVNAIEKVITTAAVLICGLEFGRNFGGALDSDIEDAEMADGCSGNEGS